MIKFPCYGSILDVNSVKEITKLGKTSLSDFTLCGAELLHKLLKQLEESHQRSSGLAPIDWWFEPTASACLEVNLNIDCYVRKRVCKHPSLSAQGV